MVILFVCVAYCTCEPVGVMGAHSFGEQIIHLHDHCVLECVGYCGGGGIGPHQICTNCAGYMTLHTKDGQLATPASQTKNSDFLG